MPTRSRCFYLLAAAALIFAVPAQAQKGFGKALLVSNGEVFVGEPENVYRPGAVHVFIKDGSEWTQRGELTAPDARRGDYFGQSVALDGNRLIIGATGGEENPGSAYVYERDGDDWVHRATLGADDVDSDDGFGLAVGLSGDYAVVGAASAVDGAGAAYVYERAADGRWAQTARLEGSNAGNDGAFGSAIVARGERVFVGAPDQNDDAGGVYIFERQGGEWIESILLEGRITQEGDRYGAALDLDGNDLVVGVPLFGNRVGGAIVYREDPSTGEWQGASLLLPYTAQNAPSFGVSVAKSGDEVWVGAPVGELLRGSAYRFVEGEDSSFQQSSMLPTAELERGDQFGRTVDIDGRIGVVGLGGDDFGAGSVAVYELSEDGRWGHTTILRSATVGLEAITGSTVDCTDGAADMFDCQRVDLLSFLPISSLGGKRGVKLNDIWGWTDPMTEREYALVGRVDGTSFVDVTNPHNPRYLGDLPKTEGSPGSTWRDMKVYRNHAYVVADGAGLHGMQVFDLTQLRSVDSGPVTFEPTAHYTNIHSAHNIVINEDTGFAYAVGSNSGGETCGGGLHMIDLEEPASPTFAGCYSAEGTGRAGTGYTHDAQCLLYDGPDGDYVGRELCFGSNETALNIADVTDKQNPINISTATYPNVSYTHQGWISEDHRYFYVNDELDEITGNADETRTLIWDVSDLDDPQLVKEYTWGVKSSDHNLYIRGNLMYQSNYLSGLRIHDISDPVNPREVGFFDTMPVGNNDPGFAGSWSNYPFFQSETIAVSSIGEGLFLLKKKDEIGL